MIAPAEALALVLNECRPLAAEEAPLADATGRVLARAVRADRDLPPAPRSAMDGYAVRAADLAAAPRELRVIGEIAAGSSESPRIRPGTCARIFTGANLPRGADGVAIIEDTEELEPGLVRFRAGVGPGENIRPRGENARKGHVLLDKGTRLGPMQISVCAAVGADPVHVYKRPQVGVLCSGRELVNSANGVRPFQERDSNGPALRAAIEQTGLAQCVASELVDDDPRAMRRRVQSVLKKCDVLLLVGGVSVGKYDFVPRVLDEIGCRKIFHRVAMKPGKPILFAVAPDGQLVFGLPGNPLSAMTGFHEFVAPALRKISGLADAAPTRIFVRLREPLNLDAGDRARFIPARLQFDPEGGAPIATLVETHSSADLVAGGQGDGVIVVPVSGGRADGLFEFHPWRPIQ